jgi:hypothetical protein
MSAPALPRIAHYPHCASSSGPEFTELAASAGLVLDDWQARDLTLGLGERDDGKWAAFQVTEIVPRQNGKDGIAEALGLGWLFLTGERLIGHSAHQYRTAMEAFRRLVGLIENTDDLRRKVKKVINTNGEEGIELLTGQRIRFLARNKGAGRGFSFDKMIWNEAYDLTAPQVDAVLPSLSARPNPQIWLMSSPPLDVTSGEVLMRARKAALAGAAGVVYLDYGADMNLDRIGPCAHGDCSHQVNEVGCILDDRALWARTNPAYPHRIGDEAIERERVTMDPTGFARERLGVWPPDLAEGFLVVSKRQWDALEDSESKAETGRPVFALSVSPRGLGPVRSSIGVARRRADRLAHIELVVSGSGTSWVPMTAARLLDRFPGARFVIDPGSPAGSCIADVEAEGVTVTTMATRDVAQAFGMIYDAATSTSERTVVHLGQAELQLAIRSAGKRPVGDGHAWDARNATADITPLVAVTNALWGLAKTGSEADPVAPWVIYA